MNFTLRQRIGATIVVLGISGILLLMFSARLYSNLALENEEANLSEMTGLKVHDLISELNRLSKDMSESIQQQADVRAALKQKNKIALTQLLNDQYYQYYVTAEVLEIARIYVYNKEFQLIAESTVGYDHIKPGIEICPEIIASAKPRIGAEKAKFISQLCAYESYGYNAILTPMGGLIPTGYLVIVTDPSFSMKPAEKDMGNPIRVKSPSGEIVYQSKDWPNDRELGNYLFAEYPLKNKNNENILDIAIVRDNAIFYKNISDTLDIILIISILIIFPAMVFSILLIRQAFKPLEELRDASYEISKGKSVRVQTSVFPEINTVVLAFNSMSENICSLVEKLEIENLQRERIQEALTENQKNLVVARDQALDAAKAKSNFLANMSHEIRTPLTAIIGFSKILQNERIDLDQRRKTTRTIVKNSEHLLSIINDILDISKIEANRLEMNFGEIELFQFMYDFKNTVADSIIEKKIDFKIVYKYPLPKIIISDEVRLKQVLINLASNAKKFTNNGHIYVFVSYDEIKKSLHFAVEDTGIGLTKEQSEKIFSAFIQADTSTTKKYGGTGLGLSISQQLVKNLGGDLDVESVRDKGSVFKFYINPGNKSELDLCFEEQPLEFLDTEFEGVTEEDFVTGTVLLVEDTIDNQILITSYLEDMGAQVIVADNGKNALDMCKKRSFDLILMDMQMPIMGGIEAVEKLRHNNYSLPIAMLTANALEGDKQRSFDAGCDEFLVKPIDLKALTSIVGKYLQKKNSIGAVAKNNNAPDLPDSTFIISSLLGKKEKLDKLVIRFVGQLPEFYSKLANAYSGKDVEKLKSEAHQLKGVGGNYGFSEITDNCLKIEDALKSGDLEAIEQLLIELSNVIERIKNGTKIYQDKLDQ